MQQTKTDMFMKNRWITKMAFIQRQIDTMTEQIKILEGDQALMLQQYCDRFGFNTQEGDYEL